MIITKRAQAGRAPLKERPGDRYDTPPTAVHALLKVERLPHHIWEPAAGRGNIVEVLRKTGHRVVASDIKQRGCPDCRGLDFLKVDPKLHCGMEHIEAIVTNPPYSLAERFVAKSLTHVPLVVMLLRLAFLESVKRTPLLESGTLARIHLFANRLPMMHRENWQGKRASSAIPFAWFVWDREHHGPITIDRIRWSPE
jgi:hypothetical protein